jgi:hypothetical protein
MTADTPASSPHGHDTDGPVAVAQTPDSRGLRRVAASGAVLLVLGVAMLQMVRSRDAAADVAPLMPASSLPPHPMVGAGGPEAAAMWLDPRTSLGDAATAFPLAVSSTMLDVGEVAPGGTASGTLHVVNRSSAEVALTRIHPLCGCTRLLSDPAPVRLAPGQVVEVPLSMDAEETPDRQRTKKVRLLVADHDPVHVSITIRSRAAGDG